MKNLETMINELCPDGVKFITISSLCKRNKGIPITAAKMKELNKEDGSIRIFAAGNTKADVDINDIDSKSVITTPSVIVKSRGNIGFEYYDKPFSHKTEMWSYTSIDENHLHIKFLYYYLSSLTTKFQTKARANSVKLPQLSIGDTDKFEIPLPPIEVQTEIVRILDKFTSLEAELEAELDCRKRQYEYYRDKLLSFDNVGGQEVEWKKMSEVGTFIRGKRFVRTDIVEEGIPCIHYGDIYTYYGLTATKAKTYLKPEKAEKMKFASKNDVVIVGAGENNMDIGVGVAWLSDEKVAIHDACYIFKSKMNPRFVSHYLRGSNYHLQIKKYVCEGKICSISSKSIGRSLIPVPSLQEQERIATILDRFESLTTSLQSGLPAEIVARRQQYEHYRDKLLTFKRKGAA